MTNLSVPLQSRRDGLIAGCEVNFAKSATEYARPAHPESPLILSKKLEPIPQGPGKFSLGSYPVPTSTESIPNLPLTAFLIRVVYNNQSFYYVKASYFKPLMIEIFIFSLCRIQLLVEH